MLVAKKDEIANAMPIREPPASPARPDLTAMAAAEFIERHGSAGLAILEERAETAERLGHQLAARTWRTMADAAARLLRTERTGTSLPGPAMAMPRVAARTLWRR
jgi:hypothetical protein